MLRRFTAGFVVTAMLFAGATPCLGWQPSAEARHDCCAKGTCPDSIKAKSDGTEISQEAADQCCASSEEKQQRDGSQSVSPVFAISPSIELVVVPRPEAIHLYRTVSSSPPVTLPVVPLYVLFSVFLV